MYVVIGGGLALNDTGIYTGSGNVPYVQFRSVSDFIPKSRCSKFAVGLQTIRNKKGVLKVRSDSEPKGQE